MNMQQRCQFCGMDVGDKNPFHQKIEDSDTLRDYRCKLVEGHDQTVTLREAVLVFDGLGQVIVAHNVSNDTLDKNSKDMRGVEDEENEVKRMSWIGDNFDLMKDGKWLSGQCAQRAFRHTTGITIQPELVCAPLGQPQLNTALLKPYPIKPYYKCTY